MNLFKIFIVFVFAIILNSCKKSADPVPTETAVNSATPVSVVFPTDTLSIDNAISD
ncbi:hypothetical protein [Halpernia sp. GG3]